MLRRRDILLGGVSIAAMVSACELLVGISDSPPLSSAPSLDGSSPGSSSSSSGDGGNACGRACIGECSRGACLPLVLQEPSTVLFLRANSTGVTWVEGGMPGRIARCRAPDCSGSLEVLATSSEDVAGLAIRNREAYFIRKTAGIQRCTPSAGCVQLSSVVAGEVLVDIDVDLSGNAGYVAGVTNRTIYRFTENGGSTVFSTFPAGAPAHVATLADVATAWSGRASAPLVVSTSCAGAASPCEIFDGKGAVSRPASELLVTASAIFFSITSTAELYRCPLAAPCPAKPFMVGKGNALGLATDGTFVYVSDAVLGTVVRVRADAQTSAFETVLTGQPGIGPIAVAGAFLFFATRVALGAPKDRLLVESTPP